MSWSRSSLVLFFLLFISPVWAVLRNFTIDDTNGDEQTGIQPSYLGPWWARKTNDDCPKCALHPIPENMRQTTWHQVASGPSQQPASISLQFNGTAVHIFCVLPGPVNKKVFVQTHLKLQVDGADAATFHWVPPKESLPFRYNQLVLSVSGLENTSHTATVLNYGEDEAGKRVGSALIFDYALYTADDGKAESDQASRTATLETTSPNPTEAANLPLESPSKERKLALHLGLGLGIPLLTAFLVLVCLVMRRVLRSRRREPAGAAFAPPPPSLSTAPMSQSTVYPSWTSFASNSDVPSSRATESTRASLREDWSALPASYSIKAPVK